MARNTKPESQSRPILPWRVFIKRLNYEMSKDNVFGRAAELAFFFLFSVFPLLLVLVNLFGILPAGARIHQDMLRYLESAAPPAAYHLVASTLEEVTRASGGGKLSLGILLTLAAASSGMVAIIEALNTAYDIKEARSWWRRRVVAIVLTLALAAFGVSALALMLGGSWLGDLVALEIGARPTFAIVWRILQWPLMAAFALLAFCLVYRFAPNVREQKWHWIFPGALAAVVLWFLATFGLRLYLHFFDSYSRTYGSLGALIVLMIWLYLFGLAILIGGEVNSVMEQSAARAGDPDAKLPGEKAPGESAP